MPLPTRDGFTETQQRFAMVVQALRGEPNVTVGFGKKGFGSAALQINGKIFAMIASSGSFVVKLPKQRVDALATAGVGQRFDPGHGRLMKEWLSVEATSKVDWLPLAREALHYVESKS